MKKNPNSSGSLCEWSDGTDPHVESALGDIWRKLLKLPAVNEQSNFFKCGGTSLLATRLVSQVRSILGVELPIAALFEEPTFKSIVARIKDGTKGRPQLESFTRPKRIPLSSAQIRLWYLHQFEKTNKAYNVPLVFRLDGTVNATALSEAIGDLIERHEILRTTIAGSVEELQQVIHQTQLVWFGLSVLDVAGDDLAAAVEQVQLAPFNLAADIPIRAVLFRTAPERYCFVVVLHHIACDRWSQAVLKRDLNRFYLARITGAKPLEAPLPVQYADYTLWFEQMMGSDAEAGSTFSRQKQFWRNALRGIPTSINLQPLERPHLATAGSGSRYTFQFPSDFSKELRSFALEHDASLFMTLHAGLSATLTGLGCGTDLPIGAIVAGRPDEHLNDLVGFFANTLVLRTNTGGDPSFSDLVSRIRSANISAYSNQDLPYEEVVRATNPDRTADFSSLVRVIITVEDQEDDALAMPGVEITSVPTSIQFARTDLVLVFKASTGKAIEGFVDYNQNCFDEESVRGLVSGLQSLLAHAIVEPTKRISMLQLADAFGGTWSPSNIVACAPICGPTISELFEAQATRSPLSTALSDGEYIQTYFDLNVAANKLARLLLQIGGTAESIIGIAVPKSFDSITAQLATAKIGAAFLYLDPEGPSDRLAYMISDAKPILILTLASHKSSMPASQPVVVLDSPAVRSEMHQMRADNLDETDRSPLSALSPAYVIYTSGSTGLPKGVLITHCGIQSLVESHRNYLSHGQPARLLHLNSLSFDAALCEVFITLLTGATLVLPPPTRLLAGADLEACISRENVTHLIILPSVLATMRPQNIPMVLDLIVAGEFLPNDLIAKWSAGRRLINAYGPTESTICSTMSDPSTDVDALSIGKPIKQVNAYILGEANKPLPTGIIGELNLSGPGLARGYINDEEQTAQVFVTNPFGEPGSRMYRTGDLVRRLSNGNYDFVARLDQQIKLRGYRVEPGEIEAILRKHEDVVDAVVVDTTDSSLEHYLVAFVVLRFSSAMHSDVVEEADRIRNLRHYLRPLLPQIMIPTAFMFLPEFPRTSGGKLDRKALSKLATAFKKGEAGGSSTSISAGLTDLEKEIHRCWCTVLERELVPTNVAFFDLGGHSLQLVKLLQLLRENVWEGLRIEDLFDNVTVGQLAWFIGRRLVSSASASLEQAKDNVGKGLLQRRRLLASRGGGEN